MHMRSRIKTFEETIISNNIYLHILKYKHISITIYT